MSLRHRSARAFTCPRCQRTTHHPKDVENAYCGCCGGPSLPRDCPHSLPLPKGLGPSEPPRLPKGV
jgi:ribosomal protein L37E